MITAASSQRSTPGRAHALAAVVALLIATGSPTASAQEPPPTAAESQTKPAAKKAAVLSPAERKKNVDSFDMIWTTIRDKHFDPSLGGVDWAKVREDLRPRVENADTMAKARAAMTEAIDRLGLTHFGIIPSNLYEDLDNPKKGTGEVGLDVRIVDGRALVTKVDEGRSAARSSVRPGWIVDKIEKKPVSELLKTAKAAYGKSGMALAYQTRAVAGRLSGPVGSSISVDFLDDKDQPVHKELVTLDPIGVPATFGNLPTFHVQFTAKRIAGDVEYVSLNIFFDLPNVLKQLGQAIEASRDTRGLIIDLRGNPGGIGAMSMAFGGWLVSEQGLKLGTLKTRKDELYFALAPRRKPYKAPVAILVDELSMSTSEILAGGLHDLKRARIFGTKTPGAALPSTIERLPNGDRFQYAFANYISTGGKPLEGLGVVPDVETPLTRASLLAGGDPAIDAAVKWIHSLEPRS